MTLIDLMALLVEFTKMFRLAVLAHISFVFRLLIMVIMIRKSLYEV